MVSFPSYIFLHFWGDVQFFFSTFAVEKKTYQYDEANTNLSISFSAFYGNCPMVANRHCQWSGHVDGSSVGHSVVSSRRWW